MNKYITERNLEADALAEYVKKAEVLDDLYHRVGELEETIEALDKNIDETIDKGLDEIADSLCHTRNQLNLERLNLEEQIHRLELDLIEFEKVRMLTK